MSVQLHAPFDLSPEKAPIVTVRHKTGCASVLVRTLLKPKNSVAPAGNGNTFPQMFNLQSSPIPTAISQLHEMLKSYSFSKSFKFLPRQLLGMNGYPHAPAALLSWKVLSVDTD
jgi:hypothetical protein